LTDWVGGPYHSRRLKTQKIGSARSLLSDKQSQIEFVRAA
jgi:hypothetical protein